MRLNLVQVLTPPNDAMCRMYMKSILPLRMPVVVLSIKLSFRIEEPQSSENDDVPVSSIDALFVDECVDV